MTTISYEFPLDRGERLLWSGQPRQGLWLKPTDVFAIPFSLMWGGFAFFWEASVIATDAPWFFKLWGIPFVAVGLWMIVGRFFWDARVRARTRYAVTTDRVMIMTGAGNPEVKSINLGALAELSVQERSDGTGTVMLGANGLGMMGAMGSLGPFRARGMPVVPMLEGIPSARQVHDLIRQAQRDQRELPRPR